MNDKYLFDSVSFGMRLSKIREFYQKSQEEVAEWVGVSLQYVQNWESGAIIPTIDNLVALAQCFNMTVGEILEDESFRDFEKKFECRKRTIETIEIEGKIETFLDFTEDRFLDRYEVWVYDDLSHYKKLYMSIEKMVSYDEFKTSMLDQADDIVADYREWLFSVLTDSKEDLLIKDQIEKKVACENAATTEPGAVFINGTVLSVT